MASSGLQAVAGEFVIVRDGAPACVIVAAEDLSLSEKTAIKELKHFIGNMSGAGLESVGMDAAGKPRIIVGEEAVKKLHPKTDLSGLGDEGFIIKQLGDDLLVAGGKLRGTMYGVYTLLEELGCYWPAPGEELIPKKKDLIVSDLALREVPILQQRNVMYYGTGGTPWGARNKINRPGWSQIPEEYGGTYRTAGHQAHNLFLLMEEAGVEVEEDMLALFNGKRTRSQMCLTHPGVIDAFTKAQIQVARSKPGVPYVQISQEDTKVYCQCERCAKIDAEAFGTTVDELDWSAHAGQMIYCINEIARAMAKEVPGTDLMFSAYLATRKPPTNVELEPNVIVGLALIESNYMRPLAEGHVEVNRTGAEDIAGWGQLTGKIFVWDYVVNYNHYNMPFPNLDVLVPNVKFYVDNNVRFFMEQAAHSGANAEFSQLRRWVLAKAMWNPEADNQELITEFLDLYYGPAASAIQEYIDATHTPSRTEVFDSRIYDHLDAPYVQADVIAAAEVAMRKADELAKGNPDYERRVRHAHLPVWYVIAHRAPGSPTWQAVEKATGEPIDLVHIAKQVQQITRDDPNNEYMAYADHEPFKPWVEWLQAYAAEVATNGKPIPPELEGVDPSTYALIQACQMDSRSRWWQKSEGASDGWACEVPTPAWTVVHYLSANEEYTPGKRYEVYVRIKPGKILADSGKAFLIGDFDNEMNAYKPHPEWDVSLIKEDGYQAFKIGEVTDLGGLWFASNPSVMEKFYLDCFWLKEVTE